MNKLIQSLNFLPRWIIILIDLLFILGAVIAAYFLRFNFNVADILAFHPLKGVLLYGACNLLAIFVTQSYSGIIRYTSIQDGLRITYTLTIGAILAFVVNGIYFYSAHFQIIPLSVLIIAYTLSVLALFTYRVGVKYIFAFYGEAVAHKVRTVIFGAGEFGIMTKQVIDHDKTARQKIVGFIDDHEKKSGKSLMGVPIYKGGMHLEETLAKYEVQELILSVKDLSVSRKNEIVDACLKQHVKVRTVPPPEKWAKGELSVGQIKEVKIEDLLGREAIQLNNPKIAKEITDNVVLVTGAAGSIGSEIVKQLSDLQPTRLVLIDQSESGLYDLEQELLLRNKSLSSILYSVVADIRNKKRMKEIFQLHKPKVVYHAAAYKHVPLMETYPEEAVRTNVLGTKLLADLSIENRVDKFVFVSTDKAVNPTSVMGASKRAAEMYVQSLFYRLKKQNGVNTHYTKFITTRFGNVLGSNGSVIPLFKKQIENGGPITVTHPEVTRYFMTIPEACQLVIEAGVMGKGGEIFIFDMGRSIKIIDLAHKMIQLSGLEVDKDIKIIFSGLREGEKLYEELLNNKENTLPTHHEKIMIVKTIEKDYEDVKTSLKQLDVLSNNNAEMELVKHLKLLIPEFKSNASRFQILDGTTTITEGK